MKINEEDSPELLEWFLEFAKNVQEYKFKYQTSAQELLDWCLEAGR